MISQYNVELIRGVLDGRILTARRSTNDEWVSIPDSTEAIRYLLEHDHSPAYCRTKPATQTLWLGCVDSVHLGWPRPTRVGAAAIIKEQWSTLATKLIRLEFEPETFKVVSCTTEDV